MTDGSVENVRALQSLDGVETLKALASSAPDAVRMQANAALANVEASAGGS